MTVLCAACAAIAVALLVRPPAARSLTRLGPAKPLRSPAASRRRWALAVPIAIATIVAAGILAGPRGAVVTAAAAITFSTVVRLVRLQRRGKAAAASRAEVAHACRVLAGQLRVGRIPAEALRVAADDCPVLASAASILDLGGDPVPSWQSNAERPGCGGLAVLARAWRVSTQTGAPLAPALERVSDALSEDLATERLVFGEVAAARATGKLMAVLPACGIGIGYLIGGRPLQFLVGGPAGWACLLGGVVTAAGGVLWIDWLSRSAGQTQAVR
jgi:tight adherence protein B